MKIQFVNRQRAFTLLDGIILGAVLLLLAAFLLPAYLSNSHRCYSRGYCVTNLKQVGIAFRIWQGDNEDQYPMNVAVTNGGAREWVAAGNVAACFAVMSNELATTKILLCPEDTQHSLGTNFSSDFSNGNVSYFLALSMTNGAVDVALCGDANLVQDGHLIPPGILNLGKNATQWTRQRHDGFGYVLGPDGAVDKETSIGYPGSDNIYSATNWVAVP